jgi:predicted metalloendopeptidase
MPRCFSPASTLFLALLLAVLPLAAQTGYHGFNPAFMDLTTPPGRDLFQYAVGRWLETTPIPPEYSQYGVDEEVDQRTFGILKEILETAASDRSAADGSDRRKAGDFYAAGMDLAAIERAGAAPLARDFEGIRAIRDRAGLARELAVLHRRGSGPAFSFGVGQDDKDSTRTIAILSQGGLGLPERDYYLLADDRSRTLRGQYLAHVTRMFVLLGEAPALAGRHAATVLAMETRLAKAAMDRVERRDPNAVYHRLTRQELAAAARGLDWNAYLGAIGLPAQEPVLVRQPSFFRELGLMAAAMPLGDWKTYLRWHLVKDDAALLSGPFDQASFDFYGRTLQGLLEQQPRWKRMVTATDGAMGEILGKLYVEKAFPPQAKARMLELVSNLRAALAERIRQLPWLGEPTRKLALAKLDAMAVKIGYPDVWRDYTALKVDRRGHAANVLAARTFAFDRDLAKLGKPVDRSEWDVSPATNNAFYDPTLNEICFPAGILQPPYFDLEADDAVNYGNIGATIGHEMTHGFDDEGRQYDALGNLRNWWTPGEAQAFAARAALMVRQFDGYLPLPGLSINGKATLGENIADLGGLKIAFDALRLSREGKPDAAVGGFTPEQRFFLGYAETWRSKIREEALRERLMTDPHAPAKYRVNGPLSNLPEFHRAFGLKDGDPMVRPEAEWPVIW